MAKAVKKTSNKVPGPAPTAVADKPVIAAVPENKPAAPKSKSTGKPTGFHLAEFKVSEYTHFCEPSDTIEDVSRFEYWCHVAARVGAMSRITVFNRVKGWEASFRVLETGKGFLKIVPLIYLEWKMPAEDSDEATRLRNLFEIGERPDGWRVTNSQGDTVAGGLISRTAAEDFVTAAVKSLTTKAA